MSQLLKCTRPFGVGVWKNLTVIIILTLAQGELHLNLPTGTELGNIVSTWQANRADLLLDTKVKSLNSLYQGNIQLYPPFMDVIRMNCDEFNLQNIPPQH